MDEDLNPIKIFFNPKDFVSNSFTSFNDFLEEGSLIKFKGKEDGYSIVQVPEAEAAFVAMNAQTGEVEAYIGGFDFKRSKLD